jgi:hypothetical protein
MGALVPYQAAELMVGTLLSVADGFVALDMRARVS